DEAAVEAAGLAPVSEDLRVAQSVDSVKALSAYMGSIQELSIKTPLGFYIDPDDKHPERYSVTIAQSGLGLPDRDYYLKADAKLEETRKAYIAHIAKVLKLAGQDACLPSAKKCKPDAAAKAKRIFELEKKLAEVHWTRVESRDSEKTYNEMTLQQLAVSAPGIDWDAFFTASRLTSSSALTNIGVAKIIVAQPSAITGTSKLIAQEPLATWREYLMFRVIDDAARFLPKAFVDENFDFYGKNLNGVPRIKERWKRGVELVTAEAGEAIGKIYVAKYFPPAAKANAEALVKNIVIAMGARIQELDWMAPETKERAKEKLAAFTVKIGYPDKFRDYSALVINRGQLWANVKSADHFEYERNLKKLGGQIDRGEWYMTPMQVNAYASFEMNELVFPAAILQPPFFDPNADDAVNYGGIGAVIGHELSHHFDDQGSKYDAHGALTDWWLPTDVERFKALTDKVVAQYNQYESLPGEHVNGELTLGENMADLAGITVAYDAYHHAQKESTGGNEAPLLNGFTGDQRFFLGWAQVWRAKYRDAYLRQLLLTDPHSPGPVRCTVVRNIDAWYQAFHIQAGQALYTAPEARIRVW
ncbi:MAG: M13 family metallopeptidase, partial [Clostridia bacterium]|nr:M13 family metallopeptidase [Deltaproteobacteria bacterium]